MVRRRRARLDQRDRGGGHRPGRVVPSRAVPASRPRLLAMSSCQKHTGQISSEPGSSSNTTCPQHGQGNRVVWAGTTRPSGARSGEHTQNGNLALTSRELSDELPRLARGSLNIRYPHPPPEPLFQRSSVLAAVGSSEPRGRSIRWAKPSPRRDPNAPALAQTPRLRPPLPGPSAHTPEPATPRVADVRPDTTARTRGPSSAHKVTARQK